MPINPPHSLLEHYFFNIFVSFCFPCFFSYFRMFQLFVMLHAHFLLMASFRLPNFSRSCIMCLFVICVVLDYTVFFPNISTDSLVRRRCNDVCPPTKAE